MRTMDVPRETFAPLEDALVNLVFPAAFGWKPTTDSLRARCGLPVRHGGLGLPNPQDLAVDERAGGLATHVETLRDAILKQDRKFAQDLREIRRDGRSRRGVNDVAHKARADALEKELRAADRRGRALRGLQEGRLSGGSSWLNALPLDGMGLCLPRQAFRDAIALRAGVELPDELPAECPSCGDRFDLDHALSCKRGGWVGRRHTDLMTAWKAVLKKAFPNIDEEPRVPAVAGPVREAVHDN